ncbi:MAG TPA: DUF5989 family protein [Phycisphaerae bacterium]|nr:DUF5989 family protein [Phycisphaerae bacterium]
MDDQQKNDSNEFLREAREQRTGLVAEFIDFLKHNKKWWLLPIIISLVLIAAFVAFTLMGGGAAAPFLYPLF